MGQGASVKTAALEKPITISSPFLKLINEFDKDEDAFFPDFEFILPGLDKPLRLHRATLARASTTMEKILHGDKSPYGSFEKKKMRLKWTFERFEAHVLFRDILMKWLRFCYGEDQTFGIGECPAALVLLLQLELKSSEDYANKIVSHMVKVASKDVEIGALLLQECIIVNKDFKNGVIESAMKTLDKTIKDEALKETSKFLKEKPELMTATEFEWEQQPSLSDFEALFKLLMTNSIPTKTLNLKSKEIKDPAAVKIGEVLRVNTTLTRLSLETNYIGTEGATKISEALMVNTTLVSLNMRWNSIKDEGASKFCEALKINNSLGALNLENNEIGDKMKSAIKKAWGSRKGTLFV